MTLTVTVLVENRSPRADLQAGRGLALHLEDDQQAILFDTGPDARLIANAERLGIDLARVGTMVLSHGHDDHSGGLPALAAWYAARGLRPRLVAHPQAFSQRRVALRLGPWSRTLRLLGAPLDQASAAQQFALCCSRQPLPLGAPRWRFLGQIPRQATGPGGKALGQQRMATGWRRDMIEDDSGLVWHGQDGLVILSGCAHAGICNLTERARALFPAVKVQAVLGGFHLRSSGPWDLYRVRRYFQALQAPRVAACHCSGWGRYWLPRQEEMATGSRLVFS